MISIIIPTYRPQDYLWQCLNSFAAQTLDKRLWELIVVLNGETDPWLKLLEDYRQAHAEMTMMILSTPEAGVSNARNIGLDHARGEYIGFVDDDDYVSETYLEELSKLATPDTIAASYTIGFSETQVYIPYYLEKEYLRCADKGTLPFHKAKKYFGGPCMKLIHRDMIADQRFDTRFKNGEDSLFMFAISPRIQYIRFTDTDTVYYRRFRTNSASGTYTRKHAIRNGWRLIAQYTHMLLSKKKYRFTFYTTRVLGVIHSIIRS